MRILFWGSPEFAVAPLSAIARASRHQVVGVVCQPDRPRGRGRKLAAPAVKEYALQAGLLPVLQPERPRGEEFLGRLAALRPDISAVVAYGHILRPEVLELPPRGSINLHASLLPAWRGAAPIQRAVAAGETVTGLTVIRMDPGMDSGPVYVRQALPIGPEESAGELAGRLAAAGAELLVRVLDAIERGEAVAAPQPETGVTFAPKLDREQARIDWSLPADRIANLIRAFDPEPGAWCLWRGSELKLFRPLAGEPSVGAPPGRVVAADRAGVLVAAGEGRTVLIRELQLQGRKRLPAREFLLGARLEPGEMLA